MKGKSMESLPTNNNLVISKVINYITEEFAEEITLEDLAEVAEVSSFQLCRIYNKNMGITPIRWLWLFRIHLAYEYITLIPECSLTDIAFSCGYSSSAHFSRFFRKIYGVSPSDFRKQCLLSDKISDNTSFFQILSGDLKCKVKQVIQKITVSTRPSWVCN